MNIQDFLFLKLLNKQKFTTKTATLAVSNWSASAPFVQTVSVDGVSATNNVIVSPSPQKANLDMANDCKIVATEQGVDALTFTAYDAKPSSDIIFNLMIGGGD